MHRCVIEATHENGEKERITLPASHWQQGYATEVALPSTVVKVELDPDFDSLDLNRRNNRWVRTE